ncbi:MAG: type II toxin-antitoxin system PemK/MazF family toxin [Flavobacteriales bacterium]|nr:type II toxin-antitoxin system PemK/MazF family toxin [Flavobacteriales bacterium]
MLIYIPEIISFVNPPIASETKKTRPSVVISPNAVNKYLRTIIEVPMTTPSR